MRKWRGTKFRIVLSAFNNLKRAAMKAVFTRLIPLAAMLLMITPCKAIDEGKPAPPLEAKLIDGGNFNLADEAGHVVIINFWASWCAPCRQEMPAMETYYKQHKQDGLRIIAISMDDPKDETIVRNVMKQYSYPAAFQWDAQYKGYGRIWRMPMTFVVDRHGILRRDGGKGTPQVDLPMLEKIITPLLEQGSH
jgi:thiol-disulfide isomerase/thioredoxin